MKSFLYNLIWCFYEPVLFQWYGSQNFKFSAQSDLNWSVLATHTLSATKLNVRPRFEPQILHCQSFMDFRSVEVQKFRAHKILPLWTRIRFSQSCFKMVKNAFYTWYLHRTDKLHMQKLMKNRKLVVIWEFILHFSIDDFSMVKVWRCWWQNYYII